MSVRGLTAIRGNSVRFHEISTNSVRFPRDEQPEKGGDDRRKRRAAAQSRSAALRRAVAEWTGRVHECTAAAGLADVAMQTRATREKLVGKARCRQCARSVH